jgi:hypothetical protein
MKMKFLALVAALVLANASHARANIIYTVHDVYHPINISPEAVDGKITTDGSFGVLTAANIVAWDLTISFLQRPLITLTNANGTVSTSGSALTATPVALLFNYGPPNFPATFLRFTAGTSLEPNGFVQYQSGGFHVGFCNGPAQCEILHSTLAPGLGLFAPSHRFPPHSRFSPPALACWVSSAGEGSGSKPPNQFSMWPESPRAKR